MINVNEYDEGDTRFSIKEKNQLVFVEEEKLTINLDDKYPFTDDDDMVKFRLCINDCVIPFRKAGAIEKPKPIDGLKLWKLKRDSGLSFEYPSENKLVHGTKSYFAREDFKINLELEKNTLKVNLLQLSAI